MNIKDFQDLALVGPPKDNLESDPLAVLHLNNQLITVFPYENILPKLGKYFILFVKVF